MVWTRPPQYAISTAKEFVKYLAKNGYVKDNRIERNVCNRVLLEFCNLMKIEIRFHLVFQSLCFAKLIKTKKNRDKAFLWFVAKHLNALLVGNVDIVNSEKNKEDITLQNSSKKKSSPKKVTHAIQHQIDTAPNNNYRNSPKKITLVDQRVALPSKTQQSNSIIDNKCDLCNFKFNNDIDLNSHTNEKSHKLRELYRTNKKELASKSNEIIIEIKNEGNNMVEFHSKPNLQNLLSLKLKNLTNDVYKIDDIILLYTKLSEFKLQYKLPIVLEGKSEASIEIKFSFKNVGAYIVPLIFQAKNVAKNIDVLKELYIYIQSEFIGDLNPTSPYKRTDRASVYIEAIPIIEGNRPAASNKSNISYTKKLMGYALPAYLRTFLNSGLKISGHMSPTDVQKLHEVQQMLVTKDRQNCLTASNYCKMLETLLFMEEHQMQKDIHDYDCSDQRLQRIKGNSHLLSLKVPGLAENRPSLIRGDNLLIKIPGDKVRYKGYVHNVHETTVLLGFHNRFVNEVHCDTQKYEVMFSFNRYPLQTEHQAIELINEHRIANHFFPTTVPNSPKLHTAEIVWYNKSIENNEEQKQAVRHIIARSSYPYPYLLFGPPGTGKTMTVVETILQLWKNRPNCNILVATPSNSAANEVSSRLIKFIPKTDLFRLISSSFAYDKIPTNLMPYCNYLDELCYFPPIETIMEYRIVIVTLTSAAKLVNAEIPSDHFSYVFIDESGHATESEVLIPIAGILTTKKNMGNLKGQVVLAGDPKQLGPIIHSKLAEAYGFGTSMLERLMNNYDVYKKDVTTKQFNPNMVTKLLQNFRSHPDILKLPDRMFYDEELIPKGNELINIALNWEHLPNKNIPIIFHSVKGKDQREENSPSYFNVQEIDIVIKYLGHLIGHRLKGRKIEQADIGIVSPYRKQVQKLTLACKKKSWNNITIGSVEQFQGQERLIIIVSTVRSAQELVEHDYKFHLGFLKNPKRFNVAITRAKALVIIIGNPDILQCDQHWGEFIQFCKENNSCTGAPFELTEQWKNNNINEMCDDFLKLNLDHNANASNENTDFSLEHADFSRGRI